MLGPDFLYLIGIDGESRSVNDGIVSGNLNLYELFGIFGFFPRRLSLQY